MPGGSASGIPNNIQIYMKIQMPDGIHLSNGYILNVNISK